MTDDWMRPITKPLPGPVPSEDAVLTALERAQIAAIAEPPTLPIGGRPQGESLASTEHLSSRRDDDARD